MHPCTAVYLNFYCICKKLFILPIIFLLLSEMVLPSSSRRTFSLLISLSVKNGVADFRRFYYQSTFYSQICQSNPILLFSLQKYISSMRNIRFPSCCPFVFEILIFSTIFEHILVVFMAILSSAFLWFSNNEAEDVTIELSQLSFSIYRDDLSLENLLKFL